MVRSLHRAAKPWLSIRGPLGAVYQTLREHGWIMVEPTRWTDPDGNTWQLDDDLPAEPALQHLRADLWKRSLEQARRHHDGEGLQGGPDITTIKATLKRLDHKGA